MRVIIESSAEVASVRAAQIIAELVQQKPSAVLGLATGSSPLRCYKELIRMHHEDALDFSNVTTFNLDEYVGLAPSHTQSYHHFMQKNLFDHINVKSENTNVPDGRALDFVAFCTEYERRIKQIGGIDLQLLGIGYDGHIAFNEPGSSLGSRTRLKSLTGETVRDNARFFNDVSEVPRLAVTMGVGTILEAKKCVLLAFGEHKADAIRATVEGAVTSQVTASALQLHQDVTILVDEAAASKLDRVEYYEEVERLQMLLEQGKLNELGIATN